MSPSHATKAGRRWRYYVSQAVLQGRKQDAGSLARVPAMEIERRVCEAMRAILCVFDRERSLGSQCEQRRGNGLGAPTDHPAPRKAAAGAAEPAAGLRAAVERVVITMTTIEIELTEGIPGEDQDRILMIPWTPPSPYRRREIIQGEGDQSSAMRPVRTKARAILIEALRDAHRWLEELTTSSDQPSKRSPLARARERSIRMTLSLTFLSPTLAKAAIDGRLPRGFGAKRLMDLPMAWSDQWSVLGLKASAEP